MLLFKEEQFPRSFVGPFIYSRYSLWNDAREDKRFLLWNAGREHWRVGVAGMMGKNCLWCEHSDKCPELSSEHHAESSYYPMKLQPWSGPRPSRLPSWNIPCSGKREHEVWWGGMKKVGRSFSLVHYQGDKQVKAISIGEASPVSCSGNDQCLYHIWTGRRKFPFGSTWTVSLQWEQ